MFKPFKPNQSLKGVYWLKIIKPLYERVTIKNKQYEILKGLSDPEVRLVYIDYNGEGVYKHFYDVTTNEQLKHKHYIVHWMQAKPQHLS